MIQSFNRSIGNLALLALTGLAAFGASVPKDVQDEVLKVKADIIAGTLQPFKGPIKDQSGAVKIDGPQPDTVTLEKTDYLVEGVVGTIPK